MVNSFIKIKTRTYSTYVAFDAINSVEEDGTGSVIIVTCDKALYDVIEINNVPCESMEDAVRELNLFDIQ
jgi:hypothetical protein